MSVILLHWSKKPGWRTSCFFAMKLIASKEEYVPLNSKDIITPTVRPRKRNMKWSIEKEVTLNKSNLCQDVTEEKRRKLDQKSWKVVLLQLPTPIHFWAWRQEVHLALLLQELVKQKQVLRQSPDLPFSALPDLFWVDREAGEQLTSTQTPPNNANTAWESPDTSERVKSAQARLGEKIRELCAWGLLSAIRTSQSKQSLVPPEMVFNTWLLNTKAQ